MKLYLIAVLFIATLVVVPCLAEEEKHETTEQVADVPEVAENKNDEAPSEATEGDAKVEAPSEATEGDAKVEEKAEGTEEQIPQEFRDEIEQEKRALPQLSTYSCRILKKYGYCRYIAKFCIKICTVPIQCKRYSRINDITRRQSRPAKRFRCDNGLRTGWYRFVGAQGTVIPNRCVPMKRCGTHASGWMVGNYPRRGQTVTRKVCYHWSKKCCNWSNNIKVTHCGGFYVFYLTKPPVCQLRYCGNA
ncbi:hypothetical protein QZH41_017688 [Actinostola sp. cb2023]|nr:hypothetical protein QZH41_017688 [Actinostola sp. cb2023]